MSTDCSIAATALSTSCKALSPARLTIPAAKSLREWVTLTARPDAREAQTLGLVAEVLPQDELLAHALAEDLTKSPPCCCAIRG